MNKVSIASMDEFMASLSIDARSEKVREFLRFKDSTNFFEFDNEEEIMQTKNVWAGYAYLIMVENLNNEGISEREKLFIDKYFNEYLLKTNPVGLENELKSFYLKYRISKDYEFNKTVTVQGYEKFKETIKALMSYMYEKNIIISYDKNELVKNTEEGTIVYIDDELAMYFYSEFVNINQDVGTVLNFLYELAKQIELNVLNDVKKHGTSKQSVIYTVEDYLSSKASKNTKLGKLYKELYESIIANKQIFIDSSRSANNQLLKLHTMLSTSKYENINKNIANYLSNQKIELDAIKHYYPDSKYFDVSNLEKDAFSKLYSMYIKGLKAMPKSMLTNVTKYFVVNGNELTLLDMYEIKERFNLKALKQKEPQKKQIAIERAKEVEEVIDFVTSQSISYKIEEEIMKISMSKGMITREFIDYVYDNYVEFDDLNYRLLNAYSNLNQLAGSGSFSKVCSIRRKQEVLGAMISIYNDIALEIMYLIEKGEYQNLVDPNKDIIVHKVSNRDKAITMLQELTGRGIISCDEMLDNSINNGIPVMMNLTPGFKEFAQQALAIKGVPSLKIQK